jgi:hypothetical protein
MSGDFGLLRSKSGHRSRTETSLKTGNRPVETRTQLQQRVLTEVQVTSSCHPDGTVYPCPAGIEDSVLDMMFKDNLLVGMPIDELVVRSFDLLMNEDEDASKAQLTRLRQRLLIAMAAVDDRLRNGPQPQSGAMHS